MNETETQLPISLEPVPLITTFGGRQRNITKLKHWYMAVAEAVQNALDAISEIGTGGKITVTIERGKDLLNDGDLEKPIENVIVEDNGIGFDQRNFTSFCTPDSLHKLDRGGKGLGRLLCIQAFQKLRVDSTFVDGETRRRRQIILQSQEPQIQAGVGDAVRESNQTIVRLESLGDDYQKTTCTFAHLTEWLVEHFLPALVEKPPWLESLLVVDRKKKLELTTVAKGAAVWEVPFTIRNYDFKASCYVTRSTGKGDAVRIVAGGRVVDANTRPLEHYIPHLLSVNPDCSHFVLIYSSFFDEKVNDARNGVTFSEEEQNLIGVTAPEFREACGKAFRSKLEDRIDKSILEFKARITEVVRRDAPSYRALLLAFFQSRDFASLSKSSGDEDVLDTIDRFRRREAMKLKKEGKRLARLQTQDNTYHEAAEKLAQQVEVQKQVALAEYVSLRKIILDRVEDLLDAKKDGKKHPEAEIHNLIFPQRTDTESQPGVGHQLWILDERLESHNYLASDKPMDGKRGDRPDLLIALDQPGAFACEPSTMSRGYERIVLVEFKRALQPLENVPTDDLPHKQMMRYARQILEEKALHLGTQRPIKPSKDARFYMYAVCEISQGLLNRLKEEGFQRSPTDDGAFTVTNDARYYVEYISLTKLLDDAKARNLAFFRRLGLEP
jgi:hypothetical protein